MGWAHCGLDSKSREIGYAIAATCDEPECAAEIDRGLAYACGGMHGQGGIRGDVGCEDYFCPHHLIFCEQTEDLICSACLRELVADPN